MSEEKKTVAKKAPEKKTIPKKTEPKNVEVEEVVESTPEILKPKVEVKPEKRVFNTDDKVEIMNNTTGKYKYTSKRSGFALEMEDYGDTEYITFGELRTMSSTQKRHISDAFIVILDEDVVKELGYEKLYKNVFNYEGVEELFNDPDKLNEVLPKMPITMRETLGAIAIRKFKNNELFDLRIKGVIEKNLKVTIDV